MAAGEEDALLVGVGLDEADVVAVPPHPTSARANETATRFNARWAGWALFMVLPIETLCAAEAGELRLEESNRPYTWGEPQPLGRRQVVRQRTLDPPHVGSNPTAPAIAFNRGRATTGNSSNRKEAGWLELYVPEVGTLQSLSSARGNQGALVIHWHEQVCPIPFQWIQVWKGRVDSLAREAALAVNRPAATRYCEDPK